MVTKPSSSYDKWLQTKGNFWSLVLAAKEPEPKGDRVMYKIPLSVARHARQNDTEFYNLELMRDEGDTGLSIDSSYRYIHEDVILDVLVEELEEDTYFLGCFNADFLSRITGISEKIIKIAQDAGAYEDLGQFILDEDLVSGPNGLAIQYAEADGYGHHFAHYDGETVELAGGWLAFRLS